MKNNDKIRNPIFFISLFSILIQFYTTFAALFFSVYLINENKTVKNDFCGDVPVFDAVPSEFERRAGASFNA